MNEWVTSDPWTKLTDEYNAYLDAGGKPVQVPDDDSQRRLAIQMGWKMFRSPLSERYQSRARALGDEGTRIQTAGQVLGEREFRLGAMLLMPDDLVAPGSIDPFHRLQVAIRGVTADPYLWTTKCWDEARRTEVPRHVISRSLLPRPRMWWTLETGYDLEGVGPGGAIDIALDGWFIADAGEGFGVYLFGEAGPPEDRRFGVWGFGYRYGMTYPDDFPEYAREASGELLSMMAFLNSPFIPKTRERPSRPERRARERDLGKKDAEDEVTFVDLRSIVQEKRDKGEEGEGVDWKHRWIVRGHNRAQWYPSESAHHLIYVAPYMKGPEDAPLLEHAYRVKR